LCDVMTLAARQKKPQRQTERVNTQVNLGGEAATTPA
jgi:hypothetical protein